MSVTAVPLQPTNNSTRMWLWLSLILAVALAFGLAWMGTRAQVAAKGTNEQFLAWNKGQSGVVTTASGVQILELKAGDVLRIGRVHPPQLDQAGLHGVAQALVDAGVEVELFLHGGSPCSMRCIDSARSLLPSRGYSAAKRSVAGSEKNLNVGC